MHQAWPTSRQRFLASSRNDVVCEQEERAESENFAVLCNGHRVLDQQRESRRIDGVNVSLPKFATRITELSCTTLQLDRISGQQWLDVSEHCLDSLWFALNKAIRRFLRSGSPCPWYTQTLRWSQATPRSISVQVIFAQHSWHRLMQEQQSQPLDSCTN